MSSTFTNPYPKERYWFDTSEYAKMDIRFLKAYIRWTKETGSHIDYLPYLIEELERRGYKRSNPEWFI
jgi:thymidylate synthase